MKIEPYKSIDNYKLLLDAHPDFKKISYGYIVNGISIGSGCSLRYMYHRMTAAALGHALPLMQMTKEQEDFFQCLIW